MADHAKGSTTHDTRLPLLGGISEATPVVLAVHAHPDDETLATGMLLAHTTAVGGQAHVVTCTLGDEGEVIPPELAHLEQTPALAEHRRGELAAAMAVLRVTHRYLGPDRHRPRWRDSGMAGSTAAAHPDAFANADLDEAAGMLARIIEQVQPHLLVTYDETGGYRHPDHIKTHQVTVAAWRRLPSDFRPPLFTVLTPHSWVLQDRAWLATGVPADARLTVPTAADEVASSVVPDAQVTHEVHAPDAAAMRDAALRAHRTQVTVEDGYYWLSNRVAARLTDREGYAPYEDER